MLHYRTIASFIFEQPPASFLELPLQLILAAGDLLRNIRNELLQDVGLGLELIELGGSEAALLDDTVKAGKLLSNPVVALGQLIKDANVVLGVLVLCLLAEVVDGLLGLGTQSRQAFAASGELQSNVVKDINGTSGSIETATSNTVSSNLFVDEGNQVLLRSATIVELALGRAGGEELDGRVTGDTLVLCNGLAVVGFSVNLANNDVGLEQKVLSQLLPGRSQVLAVYFKLALHQS